MVVVTVDGEARRICTRTSEDESTGGEGFFVSETVTRTEYKKPQHKAGGWANGFKNQLLGQ